MSIKKCNVNALFIASLCGISANVLAAKEDFIAPPMVNIPAGEFIMGTNSGGKAAQPAHRVAVEAFQMAKYPVTVAEFRKFVEDTGFEIASDCKDKLDRNWLSSPDDVGTARWDNNRYLKSEYQPVNCINYREASAYAKWISEKTGTQYRLPTEQEFEYAEKANTTSRYFWGDDPDMSQACQYGNIADHAGEYFASREVGASYVGFIGHTNCDDGEPYITLVGLYRPNPFGLYDVIGNVFQLLGSCYYDGYQARTEDEMDITKCEYIAHRGESWHYSPQPHEERGRYKKEGWSPSSLAGFRLAADGHSQYIDKSTEQFEVALRAAQRQHLATRPKLPKAPENVQLVQLSGNDYELRWQPSADNRVTGYEIYQAQSPYSHLLGGFYQEHYKKVTTVRSGDNSVEVSLPNDGGSYRVVTKTAKLTSLPSEPAIAYEPKTMDIPGELDMQETVLLEGLHLRHRAESEERPELYYISALNHTYKQPKVTTTFNVNVKKSGWYKVNYSAFTDQKGAFFKIWQGNRLAGEISHEPDSENADTEKSDAKQPNPNRNTVYLEQGKHQLQLSVKREGFDRWALGTVKFAEVAG